MLQNEISLRNYSGGTAHLRAHEGTLFKGFLKPKSNQENPSVFTRSRRPLVSLIAPQLLSDMFYIASRLTFYLILVTSIGGKSKPEICFFPGLLKCSR